VIPDPLPVPKEGKTVEVPDFSVCAGDECLEELAAQSHLVIDTEFASLGDFQVISFTPPKDTPVPEGTLVKIVIRHPIVFFPELLHLQT
jgi:hypothetical protein